MSANKYETVLQEKLQSANLSDLLNAIQSATNTDTAALIDGNADEIKSMIYSQIVDAFINILKDVQKEKAEHDADDQFASELADDVVVDIPEVFPLSNENPDAEANTALVNDTANKMDDNDDEKENKVNVEEDNNAEHDNSKDNKENNADNNKDNKENNEENTTDNVPSLAMEESVTVLPEIAAANKEIASSPHDQLKALYVKEEKERLARQNSVTKKTKIKLRVGSTVEIYSASKKLWNEGIIKEIKGDILCVVYGRKMKWLKKDSKQLRVQRAASPAPQ